MEQAMPNNDLKNSKEQVMSNLASIRVGKTKLLKMLANLKETEDRGEAVDKELIGKLVEAYDGLNKQEEDYIRVIREIIQQQVVEYAKESKKDTNEKGDEESTAEDIIREVDEIEKDAIAASQKHDLLISTIKERLEKKMLLDHIHQIEQQPQNELLEQLELTKLRLANEQESVDRSEEIRNRLRREAAKRGYLNQPSDTTPKVPETSSDQRVPPLTETTSKDESKNVESKEEIHAKIQRHIDQIKARKERMRECYEQAEEMLSLKKAYDDAVKRSRELESMQKHLQDLKIESEEKEHKSEE